MNSFLTRIQRLGYIKMTLVGCGLYLFAISAFAATPILTPIAVEKRGGLQQTANPYLQATKTAATPIAFHANALDQLRPGDEAALSLPNGRRYIFVAKRSTRDANGNVSRVASLQHSGGRYLMIATTGPAGTFATIETPEDSWSIVPGPGGDTNFLFNGTQEARQSQLRPHADDVVRIPSQRKVDFTETSAHRDLQVTLHDDALRSNVHSIAAAPVAEKSSPTPQRTIDIMVVITPGFAAFHGANLDARISQAFAEANASFARSEVAITLNKVGPTLVRNYADPTSAPSSLASSADLNAFTDNTGDFADIEDLRWAYGADLVTLFRQPPPNRGSGIAWLGSFENVGGMESWAASRYMYSVIDLCNFAGCDTTIFAHELGHNMGLQHDRATELSFNPDYVLPPGVRPYAFGHTVATNNDARDFRTIMAYTPPDRPVAVFSNPNLFICNPAGFVPLDACGVANVADNARALNENRNMLASIRTATAVSLMAELTLLSASATAVTLQVSRLGGTAQPISVDFQTSDGTAIGGIDYTPTSGTLTWAANDTSVKTITVPLLTANNFADRAFTVTLDNPVRTTVSTPAALTLTREGIRAPGKTCPVGAPT